MPGYCLVRRLGTGGAGEVWRAEGPGGLPVALKLVPLAGKLGEQELNNLRILRAVRHPNLLAYFGAWTTDDLLIIGMELADGSLWDYFHQVCSEGCVGIPLSELLVFMSEVAGVVDFLHEPRHELDGKRDVAIHHRDIKPQNIMLLGRGVKVADFGLSGLYEQCTQSRTQDGLTYPYAAPELFRRQPGEHSDQYSLAMSYCLLRGGRLPFVGPPASVMYGHLFEPPDLSMLPLPEQPIVLRALAKDSVNRWPTCGQFIEALRIASAAGSPETIPADDRVLIDSAASRCEPAAQSEEMRFEAVSDYLIEPSSADNRSEYQLGSLFSSAVAEDPALIQQSQAATVVLPAGPSVRAQPHWSSILIRGTAALLVLLALGSSAMLAPKVPQVGVGRRAFNDPMIVPQAKSRYAPSSAGRLDLPDPLAAALVNSPPPLEPLIGSAETAAALVNSPPALEPLIGSAEMAAAVENRSPRFQTQSLRSTSVRDTAARLLRGPASQALQIVSRAQCSKRSGTTRSTVPAAGSCSCSCSCSETVDRTDGPRQSHTG